MRNVDSEDSTGQTECDRSHARDQDLSTVVVVTAAEQPVIEVDHHDGRARVDRRVDARQRRRENRRNHESKGASGKGQRHENTAGSDRWRNRAGAWDAENMRKTQGRRTTAPT